MAYLEFWKLEITKEKPKSVLWNIIQWIENLVEEILYDDCYEKIPNKVEYTITSDNGADKKMKESINKYINKNFNKVISKTTENISHFTEIEWKKVKINFDSINMYNWNACVFVDIIW